MLYSPVVVHKDLKSANVLLDANGHGKLTDFGISRVTDEGKVAMTSFCGTVAYMVRATRIVPACIDMCE
jgi:serine/threonine protein kinase